MVGGRIIDFPAFCNAFFYYLLQEGVIGINMVYFASFYHVNFEKAHNVPSWKVYLWTVGVLEMSLVQRSRTL